MQLKKGVMQNLNWNAGCNLLVPTDFKEHTKSCGVPSES
jgi:hypothetical protein